MPDAGNGPTIRWRLQSVEETLKNKAETKDVDNLARIVREGFKELKDRDEQNRVQSKADRRRAFWYVFGAVVTLGAAFIGSGHIG